MVFVMESMLVMCALLVIVCGISQAQEIITISEGLRIEMLKSAELTFQLPDISKDKQVRLQLDGRIDWPSLGGNTFAVSISINGKPVQGQNLLNKPLKFTMREGSVMDWATRDGNSYRLMYSPDYSDRIRTDKDYQYGLFETDQDPYHFVWDITPLVHKGNNTLTLVSDSGLSFTLDFRNICVETGKPLPKINMEQPPKPAPTGNLPVYVPTDKAHTPTDIKVSQSGNISWTIGKRTFNVVSRWSQPDGKWNDNPKDNWRTLSKGKSVTIENRAVGYSIARRVTLHNDHISIRDTITNQSSETIGVILENRLKLPEKPIQTRLCGSSGGMDHRTNAAHPTAIAQLKDLLVGISADDDVFRFHGSFFEEAQCIGAADPCLAVPAGKTIALDWSIYIIPSGDYWDFVNAVRNCWRSNFTLQGPLTFPPADICNYIRGTSFTADELKAWLKSANYTIKRIMTHVAVDPNIAIATATLDRPAYKHGTAILQADAWIANTKHLVQEMKKADPSVRIYAYTHKNLCTEVGYPEKYRDSVAVDAYGKPVTSVYNPPPGLFVPTTENSYGKAMMEVYRYIVEQIDADVYIDEINVDYLVTGDGEKVWDGCTAVIDPKTHALVRKQSNPGLLVLPWLTEVMEYIHSKNKLAYFNGYITSRTMLSWGQRGFLQTSVEDGCGLAAITNQHLGTPLAWAGYMSGLPGYNHFHESLNYGGIPFTRSGIWNDHTFPITPISLREGVIIAKERILTSRSGSFGWNDNSRAQVYVYDGKGEPVSNPNVKTVTKAGQTLTEVRMPSDHTAVLVRQK